MQIVRSGYGPNDRLSSVGPLGPGVTIVSSPDTPVTQETDSPAGFNRSFIIVSEDNNLINHKRFINICLQQQSAPAPGS